MAGFDDGKDPGALRSIGEVSDALGIKPHVLRYWEEQFPSLTPLKRAGGRRLYRAEDIAVVQEIARLVTREGYTLKGARVAIGGERAKRAAPHPGHAQNTVGPGDFLSRLKAIRAQLADALDV